MPDRPLKVLNLYAGLGGNRKLWGNVEVTAVEKNQQIATVYQRLFPQDRVIVADAHEFLLDNVGLYDFIWSSPPCQSHSRMNKGTRHKLRRYPDFSLYEEIVFLEHYCPARWVVENVVPYYRPLKSFHKIGRHLFWANFRIDPMVEPKSPSNFINRCNLAGKKSMQEWLGIHYPENIYYEGNHCPAQVLRNCVHPDVGLHVFECAVRSMIPEELDLT